MAVYMMYRGDVVIKDVRASLSKIKTSKTVQVSRLCEVDGAVSRSTVASPRFVC
jgi:hypothetical protein